MKNIPFRIKMVVVAFIICVISMFYLPKNNAYIAAYSEEKSVCATLVKKYLYSDIVTSKSHSRVNFHLGYRLDDGKTFAKRADAVFYEDSVIGNKYCFTKRQVYLNDEGKFVGLFLLQCILIFGLISFPVSVIMAFIVWCATGELD